MIIYLTSERPAKVEGARDAIAAIAAVDDRFASADIRCVDLGDAGPRMPLTEKAIIAGAGRRVSVLFDRLAATRPPVSRPPPAAGQPPPASGATSPEAPGRGRDGEPCYAVGLEGGLDPLSLGPGGRVYALKTWACVSDGTRWSWGAGGAVILPADVASEVLAGRELGEVIDARIGSAVRGTRGAWGVLTRDLVTRRDAFRVAVISAFAPFFNRGVYQ